VVRMTNWQPILKGSLIRLRPLVDSDYDALHAAASDPLIWEQHPDRERYKHERFQIYFRSGIESKGALVVIDPRTDAIIGSSRFADHDPAASTVEVGYTFLTRDYWGKGYNHELKKLMLDYAFEIVDAVLFFVGDTNFRSQAAMKKVGAVEIRRENTPRAAGAQTSSVVFEIKKSTRQS